MSSTTTPGDALRAAVQPGSLRPKPRHDRRSRVPAHRLRVQTSPTPNQSNCPRWRASEYCSAKAGSSRAFPSRCVLLSLSRTPTRATRTPF
jgi:hypothetical protein